MVRLDVPSSRPTTRSRSTVYGSPTSTRWSVLRNARGAVIYEGTAGAPDPAGRLCARLPGGQAAAPARQRRRVGYGAEAPARRAVLGAARGPRVSSETQAAIVMARIGAVPVSGNRREELTATWRAMRTDRRRPHAVRQDRRRAGIAFAVELARIACAPTGNAPASTTPTSRTDLRTCFRARRPVPARLVALGIGLDRPSMPRRSTASVAPHARVHPRRYHDRA